MLDLVKKTVLYRKALDFSKLNELLRHDCWVVEQIAALIGVSEEDLREHNMQKLEKGTNARYKEGYSDAAAQARRDKAAEGVAE